MSIASMPIGGNNLNRYSIPTPIPRPAGTPTIAAATNFTPRDGFWSREMDRIILISDSNSGVYNYDGVRNTISLHQQAGLVGGINGDLNHTGDRIACIRTNNLTILQYDKVSGLLAADVTLTDSIAFSHALYCAWDPTGEFIAVANNDHTVPNRVINIIRYVRSPASLSIVADFRDVPNGGRECISWGSNNIITAGGIIEGFWGLRFDPVTNTLTRFSNLTGSWRHETLEASPTGEFITAYNSTHHIVTTFRYTPSPDTLTLLNSVSIGLKYAMNTGSLNWNSDSRIVFLPSFGTASAGFIGIMRFDPIGLGMSLWGEIFHSTTVDAQKTIFNNIFQVIAVIRNSSTAPIAIMPFASNIIF